MSTIQSEDIWLDPYRNLPAQSPIRRLALDATVIKLGSDVGGLLAAVNLAVGGAEEEKLE